MAAGDGWESVGHELIKELKKIKTGVERVAFIKGRVSMLPPEQRDNVEQFVVALMFASKDDNAGGPAQAKWEKPAAFVFGLSLMIALMVLAIFVPTPTPFQYEIFRVVLAAGVAGFAACIPGLVQLKLGNWLHAVGAFAIFGIVYFYSPARLIVDQTVPTSTTAPAKLPSPPQG